MGKFGIIEWIILFVIAAGPVVAVLIMVIYKSNKKKKLNRTFWDEPGRNANQKNDIL